MIRIKQGSRWVRSRRTEYRTILSALFDRIIRAVGNGDMKTPQDDWDGHNLSTHLCYVTRKLKHLKVQCSKQVTCCQRV